MNVLPLDIFPDLEIDKCKGSIKTYGGNRLETVGTSTLDLKYNGNSVDSKFVVANVKGE